ncbi:DUF3667 domain-containing protein [Pleionea sediminis]|uniref:DUF3667 domain-containing protein n=1 Tax=Pleionea sediminis TaxID=2569479 RepID=UPI0011860503|nr:DUF3667 domain-containing protein [Pleionea sediminis]
MTEHVATDNSELEQKTPDTESMQVCKNCQTPLSGPFCHQCGQPSKSIIRFFGSLAREFFEDIINLDSRAFNTLIALLFRPGFLTKEYVSGKRFKYVPPLRLFLLTSLFCIFVIWIINKTSDTPGINVGEKNQEISLVKQQEIYNELGLDSEEKLEQLSDSEKEKLIKELEQVNRAMSLVGTAPVPLPKPLKLFQEKNSKQEPQKKESNETADKDAKTKQTLENELANLPTDIKEQIRKDIEENSPSQKQSSSTTTEDSLNIQIEDEKANVNVNIPFFSEEENKRLEKRLEQNIQKIKEDPRDFIGDLLEVIPKSMLLLVPIFAVLIKISYPFARRYYIEHLIHAFHGHAFLFLSILILIGLEYASSSLNSSENGFFKFIGGTFGFLEVVMFIWIPLYFLISMKRVYQQNWFLTVWKWLLVGILYFVLFITSAVILLLLSVYFN